MNRINRAIDRRLNKLAGNEIIYLKLFAEAHQNDDYHIYYESTHKEYHDLIPLKAIVRYSPSEKFLQDLGFEEQTEVVVRISLRKLRLAGLVDNRNKPTLALDRDLMVIDNEEYNILGIAPIVQYQGNQHLLALGGRRV